MGSHPTFIGREREVATLSRIFVAPKPALVIIYGRRRVGKSTLLRHVIARLNAVYYQATRVSDADNLELFKRTIASTLGNSPVLGDISGWEGILQYLGQTASGRKQPLIVVLDEFPYLCEGNSGLPSIVQKVWDDVRLRQLPLILVLCGSRISFMETLLAERNPLHGRQSAELSLQPLTYREAAAFVPEWSVDERLKLFGVFGAMPYYLSLIDPAVSLATNIRLLLLDDGAPLKEEPTHLLQAELGQMARYASILRAVADGCTQLKDIAGRVLPSGESSSSLTAYISTLQGLRLVSRIHSLDVRDPERSRNTRYFLEDPFLAFYYRFILPNLSAIQAGHGSVIYRTLIAPRLDEYMGEWFEIVCRQWLRFYSDEKLSAVARITGKIWAGNYDIDVAGELIDGTRIAGECKWRREPTAAGVLRELQQRAAENAFYANHDTSYLVFSRSTPTAELRKLAANGAVTLLGPADLVGARRRKRARRPTPSAS